MTLASVPQAVVAAVLAGSIWWAFFGPPPRRRASSSAVGALGGAGVAIWSAGALLTYLDAGSAAIVVALAIEALCAATWLGRASGGGGDGGEPVREPPPEPPGESPGVDWGAFDRARERWERPRVPS